MTSFWSESYSTKKGILTESYHRVCLEIDANDPGSYVQVLETFASLAGNYFLHLILKYQTSFNTEELKSALAKLEQSLPKPEAIFDRLLVSISIPLSFISTYSEELQQVGSIKCCKILFINLEGVVDSGFIRQTLQQLPLEDYRTVGISLGLQDFSSHDMIASFLEREVKSLDNILQIIGMNVHQLPHLHVQSVELCHRHGLLFLLSMPANYFSLASDSTFQRDIMQYYGDLPAFAANSSDKQGVETPPMILLLKAILQLGSILSLPYPLTAIEHAVYMNTSGLSRLPHPFIHRKQYVSGESSKLLSLSLSEEIMAVIEERSMKVEQELDVQRVEMYSRSMPVPIQLTFFPAEETKKEFDETTQNDDH